MILNWQNYLSLVIFLEEKAGYYLYPKYKIINMIL